MGRMDRVGAYVRFVVEASLVVLGVALIAVPEWREGWPKDLLVLAIVSAFAFTLRDFHRAKLLNLTIAQLHRTPGKPLGSALRFVGLWVSFVAIVLPAP